MFYNVLNSYNLFEITRLITGIVYQAEQKQ